MRGGVDPADTGLQAAQVPLVVQVGECSVEQSSIAVVIQRRIDQFERGQERQVEGRERAEQHRVGAGLANAALQVGGERFDQRAPLGRREPACLVDARGNDAIADVVTPLRVA